MLQKDEFEKQKANDKNEIREEQLGIKANRKMAR